MRSIQAAGRVISFLFIILLFSGCPGLLSSPEEILELPVINGLSAGFFNEDISFTLSGNEGCCLEYSLDEGSSWIVYNGEITLSDEGTYLVTAHQIDKSDTVSENTPSLVVVIDKTVPDLPSLTGLAAGFFNQTLVFSLSGEEGAVLEYSLDNGKTWTSYIEEVSLKDEGSYHFVFRQTDRAGNVSVVSSPYVISIDKSLPDAPTLSGLSAGFFNSAQKFTLTGESGSKVEYSLDGGTIWTAYDGEVSLSSDGTFNIIARQTDSAGNVSAQSSPFAITIDTLIPDLPKISGVTEGLFNSDQSMTITGEEGAKIEYTTDGGTIWTEYSAAVTLSSDGSYSVQARQTDKAGNVSASTSVLSVSLDKTIPTASYTIENQHSLSSARLIISFSESMNTNTLSLSRSLFTSDAYTTSWSKKNSENDTLTIAPKTSWSIALNREMLIKASDKAGNKMVDLALTCDPGYIFVNGSSTEATADGSRKYPYHSISSALAAAPSGHTIQVAKGTYSVSSSLNLKEGVILYGGYDPSDWSRNISGNITHVKDSRTSGGSESDPNVVFVAGSGITTATVLDGFTIEAGGGDHSSIGVMCYSGGSPTISNNIIKGGTATEQAVGVMVWQAGSSPVIKNNSIYGLGTGSKASRAIKNAYGTPKITYNLLYGGSGTEETHGIQDMPQNSTDVSTIFCNTIDGGSGAYNSYGIQLNGGSSLVVNNVINGGIGGTNSANGTYPAPGSMGIYSGNGTHKIYHNTINAGKGTKSYAIWTGRSTAITAADIKNNILYSLIGTGAYGIYEYTDNNCNPSSVANNCVYGFSAGLYGEKVSGNNYDTISGGNFIRGGETALSSPAATGTVNINPQFSSSTDPHLSSSTPSSVANGGLNLSTSGVLIDRDGNQRTAPYSMGAYEKDGIPIPAPPS